jgi:hypothetical protein
VTNDHSLGLLIYCWKCFRPLLYVNGKTSIHKTQRYLLCCRCNAYSSEADVKLMQLVHQLAWWAVSRWRWSSECCVQCSAASRLDERYKRRTCLISALCVMQLELELLKRFVDRLLSAACLKLVRNRALIACHWLQPNHNGIRSFHFCEDDVCSNFHVACPLCTYVPSLLRVSSRHPWSLPRQTVQLRCTVRSVFGWPHSSVSMSWAMWQLRWQCRQHAAVCNWRAGLCQQVWNEARRV